MRYLIFITFIISASFADYYVAQIKPYQKYEIKSEYSGVVTKSMKSKEFSFIKDRELIVKVDSSDENIKLSTLIENLETVKDILEIKKRNLKSKERVKQLSSYDKNLERLSFLETKIELANTKESIRELKNIKNRKEFFVQNRYIDEVYVNEGEFVNSGDTIFTLYDISKEKIELFIKADDIEDIEKKRIYIDERKSKFRVEKISKVKDSKKLSTYKLYLVRENSDFRDKFWDKIVKVEFR